MMVIILQIFYYREVIIISNTQFTILSNLYYSGVMKKEDMAIIETFNKDFKIELVRKESKLWFTDKSFKFLCIFKFYNSLGLPLFEIVTNEIDIFIMIDNIYHYNENNINEIEIPINTNSSNLKRYKFIFTRNLNVYNNTIMTITEYDIIQKRYIDRIKIEFDEDTFNSFTNLIYFTFLIDIDGFINPENFI